MEKKRIKTHDFEAAYAARDWDAILAAKDEPGAAFYVGLYHDTAKYDWVAARESLQAALDAGDTRACLVLAAYDRFYLGMKEPPAMPIDLGDVIALAGMSDAAAREWFVKHVGRGDSTAALYVFTTLELPTVNALFFGTVLVQKQTKLLGEGQHPLGSFLLGVALIICNQSSDDAGVRVRMLLESAAMAGLRVAHAELARLHFLHARQLRGPLKLGEFRLYLHACRHYPFPLMCYLRAKLEFLPEEEKMQLLTIAFEGGCLPAISSYFTTRVSLSRYGVGERISYVVAAANEGDEGATCLLASYYATGIPGALRHDSRRCEALLHDLVFRLPRNEGASHELASSIQVDESFRVRSDWSELVRKALEIYQTGAEAGCGTCQGALDDFEAMCRAPPLPALW